MSDDQTEQLIRGKSQLATPTTSTEVMQRSETCTNLLNCSSPSITCQPTDSPNHDSGLKSTIRMLMQLPMLWGGRLSTTRNSHANASTTVSKPTSEASSEDEEAFSNPGEIGTPLAEQIQDSPSKNKRHSIAREYRDVLDLCSSDSVNEWDRNWDRDGDRGAVVDADMLCMRALVDGVHIIYL
jgi:hypothetical protein